MKKTIIISLTIILTIAFSFVSAPSIPKAYALTWSSPQEAASNPYQSFSMDVDSAGHTHMVYDYHVPETSMEYTATDTASETIAEAGPNTRIAQKFHTPSGVNKLITSGVGISVQQSTGGTLVGALRIETDNAGQPSGNLVAPEAEQAGITFAAGSPTTVNFSSDIEVTPDTDYWLVIANITSGSGTFDGGTGGPSDQCMYYDGSWHLSSNVENIYFTIRGEGYAVYYTNNVSGSWSTPVDVYYGKPSLLPSIAVDNNGNLHVVLNYNSVIIYRESTDGGVSWGNTANLGSTGETPPVIVTDSSNNSHVVYYGASGEVWYTTNAEGGWSTRVDVTGGSGSIAPFNTPPALSLDASDKCHVAYTAVTGPSSTDVFYVNNISGSWSAPEQVSTTTADIFQFPSSIAVESGGTVHIGYTYCNPSMPIFDVYHADNAGGSWHQENLTTGSDTFCLMPSLTLSAGKVHLAYMDANPGTGVMNMIYIYKEAGSWSTPETVATTHLPNISGIPLCSLIYGSLHLGYLGNDGSSNKVYYTYAATGPPPPTVSSIAPNSGINTGPVDVTITGTNFVSGATVKLTKTGQTDINATGVVVDSSTQITCTLPITGAATGAWNVVVTNPDAQQGILTDGFSIYTLPSSVVISPANNSATNTPITSITGITTSGGIGIAAVQISLKRLSDNKYWDGTDFSSDVEVWNTCTGTISWSYDTSGISWTEGWYTVRSRAIDAESHQELPGTGSTFCYDISNPTQVAVTNLIPGQVITTNPYTLEASAIDTVSGIQRVEFYVDDHLIGTDYDAPYSCNWDTALYHSQVKIIAYDQAGNNTSSDPINVTVQLPSGAQELPYTGGQTSSQIDASLVVIMLIGLSVLLGLMGLERRKIKVK